MTWDKQKVGLSILLQSVSLIVLSKWMKRHQNRFQQLMLEKNRKIIKYMHKHQKSQYAHWETLTRPYCLLAFLPNSSADTAWSRQSCCNEYGQWQAVTPAPGEAVETSCDTSGERQAVTTSALRADKTDNLWHQCWCKAARPAGCVTSCDSRTAQAACDTRAGVQAVTLAHGESPETSCDASTSKWRQASRPHLAGEMCFKAGSLS